MSKQDKKENEDKKEVEVSTEVSVEVAKDIAKEMAKTFVDEMKLAKEEEVKVISNKVIQSNQITVSERKYTYYGKLNAYKDTELAEAYEDGIWFKATQMKDTEAMQYCQDNGIQTKDLSEGTNSAGGYTVPNQLVARVIRLVDEYGLGRKLSDVFAASSDTVWVPKGTTNTTAKFIVENDEKEKSEPAFTQVEVLIKKLVVLTKISDELIEDSVINMIDYVVTNMARAIAQKEDEVVFYGSGGADDGGITGIITAIESVSGNESIVDVTTSGGWAKVGLEDFNTVMGRLRDYAYNGKDPVWICSNSFYHQVMNRIKAAAGGNYIATLENGFRKEFLGYEVQTTPVLPTTSYSNPSDVQEYCLFGRMDLVAAFASRHDARVKTTQEGDAFVYNQLWIRMEERFGYKVHDQGTADKAGSMILLNGVLDV